MIEPYSEMGSLELGLEPGVQGQQQLRIKSGLIPGPQLQSVRFPTFYQGGKRGNFISGPPRYGVKSDKAPSRSPVPEIRSSDYIPGPNLPEAKLQHVKPVEGNVGPCLQAVKFSDLTPEPKHQGFRCTQVIPDIHFQDRKSQGLLPESFLPLSQEPQVEDRKLVLPMEVSEFHSRKHTIPASELQYPSVISQEVNPELRQQDTKFSELSRTEVSQPLTSNKQLQSANDHQVLSYNPVVISMGTPAPINMVREENALLKKDPRHALELNIDQRVLGLTEKRLQPQRAQATDVELTARVPRSATDSKQVTPVALLQVMGLMGLIPESHTQVIDCVGFPPQPPNQAETVNLTPRPSDQVIEPKPVSSLKHSATELKSMASRLSPVTDNMKVTPEKLLRIMDSMGLNNELHPHVIEPAEIAPKPQYQVMGSAKVDTLHDHQIIRPEDKSLGLQQSVLGTVEVIPQPQHKVMGTPNTTLGPQNQATDHIVQYMKIYWKLAPKAIDYTKATPPKVMDSTNLPPELQNVKSEHLIPDPRLRNMKSVDTAMDLVPEKVEYGPPTSRAVSTDLTLELHPLTMQFEELTHMPQLQKLALRHQAPEERVGSDVCHQVEESVELPQSSLGMRLIPLRQTSDSREMYSPPPLQETLETRNQVVKEMEETPESQNAIKRCSGFATRIRSAEYEFSGDGPRTTALRWKVSSWDLESCSEITLRSEYEDRETIRVTFPKVDDTQGGMIEPYSEMGSLELGLEPGVQVPEIRSSDYIPGPNLPEAKLQHVKPVEGNVGPCLQAVKFSDLTPEPKHQGFRCTQVIPDIHFQDRKSQGLLPESFLPLSQEPQVEDRKLVLPMEVSEFHCRKHTIPASELQYPSVISQEVNPELRQQDTKFSELSRTEVSQPLTSNKQLQSANDHQVLSYNPVVISMGTPAPINMVREENALLKKDPRHALELNIDQRVLGLTEKRLQPQRAQATDVELTARVPRSATDSKQVTPVALLQVMGLMGLIPESHTQVIDCVGFPPQPPNQAETVNLTPRPSDQVIEPKPVSSLKHSATELKSMASRLSPVTDNMKVTPEKLLRIMDSMGLNNELHPHVIEPAEIAPKPQYQVMGSAKVDTLHDHQIIRPEDKSLGLQQSVLGTVEVIPQPQHKVMGTPNTTLGPQNQATDHIVQYMKIYWKLAPKAIDYTKATPVAWISCRKLHQDSHTLQNLGL
ncbi:hypothetical protein ACRRTK_015420 [Alexandromys fortis]